MFGFRILPAFAACLLLPACNGGPVGDKAAADNKAFQDDDNGFFGSFLTPKKKPPVSRGPGVPGICSFSAWAASPEPTVIRSGPGKGFAALGTLPAARPTKAGLRGIEAATFEVVEARHGWFRIDKARYQRLDFDEAPVVYPTGWIPGDAVSFALQSDFAYERPDAKSPVVATSWNEPSGTKTLRIESPHYCQGEWVLVNVAGYDGLRKPAWLRGACGKLDGTCDDIVSDNPPKPADLPGYPVPAAPVATDVPVADPVVSEPATATASASARPRR